MAVAYFALYKQKTIPWCACGASAKFPPFIPFIVYSGKFLDGLYHFRLWTHQI